MNAVEIEEAISELASAPFHAEEFPFAFLTAFGNKETTVKRLRTKSANISDVAGGVLQRNNIHLAVCAEGKVGATLSILRQSPKTAASKAKFILATDGSILEAEDMISGEVIASEFANFAEHFGFFLPLAGITTVKQIRESSFDIKATGRLNRLYIELLKNNPDWADAQQRQNMNHFMARLIFCFFAENTDIFSDNRLFTTTIERMSAADASNTHEVISELFRAMNTQSAERATAKLPRWAEVFPYVNGGLFSGSVVVPRCSKIARSYLLHIGNLDWKKINPDIFGSMIQAVADDNERSSLGMHYTSVPNILKVLNPLFLDELRTQLQEAGDNQWMLLNLRKRMAKIRVFDPACGSGNFLVIAYKEMRAIEAAVNQRRREQHLRTKIPLTNFRGIELRDFSAEIARLALIIAEYQCDILYYGQKEALTWFLPLDAQNWITCGNALRLDWLSICPPTGDSVKFRADDLFYDPADQAQIDFNNAGGETYICGNPPYRGSTWQSLEQKADLQSIFDGRTKNWKSLDYVAGWFMKAADYGTYSNTVAAFVSTNSICQGQQVPILWPLVFATGHKIAFAYTNFKWANLASHNAGVTVVIVGISNHVDKTRQLFSLADDGDVVLKNVENINAYLINSVHIIVDKTPKPLCKLAEMNFGNKPVDGGHLLLTYDECQTLLNQAAGAEKFIKHFIGSEEFIRGKQRYCLWIEDQYLDEAIKIQAIQSKLEKVAAMRRKSEKIPTKLAAETPHKFAEVRQSGNETTIVVPSVSSENRDYLPVGLLSEKSIVANSAFALYDAPLWNMALIASRLHLVWIATVCGKLGTSYRYSNTLGWNTFPVPLLTEQNQIDLISCAENILLAREVHFPATIADLYEQGKMPENLRRAHDENDETIERIYIGRKFKNDTERLEKLFDFYGKMLAKKPIR